MAIGGHRRSGAAAGRRETPAEPRTELAALVVLSFLGMNAPASVIPVYILLFFPALGRRGLGPGEFFRQTRGLLALAGLSSLLAGLLNYFALPQGGPAALAESLFLSRSGVLFFRLFLLIQGALYLSRGVPPGALRKTVTWGASFIPGVSPGTPEKAGLLFSLAMSSIPYLLGLNREIRSAQKVRGSEQIANPLRRLAAPVFPLLLGTLLRSRVVGDALLARGFGLDRTEREDPAAAPDSDRDSNAAGTGEPGRLPGGLPGRLPGGLPRGLTGEQRKALRREALPPWTGRNTGILAGRLVLLALPAALWRVIQG